MNIVCLFSPGIDSLINRAAIEDKYPNDNFEHGITYLYYDIKSKYSEVEKEYLKKILIPIVIDDTIDLSSMEQENAYIPNRNILLAIHAASKYNADIVYLGGSKSDRVSDLNKPLYDALSLSITQSTKRLIKFDSLFWDVYKEQMISWYLNVFAPKDRIEKKRSLVEETFSCYYPNKEPISFGYKIWNEKTGEVFTHETKECMMCEACFRKSCSLFSCGIFRPFLNKDIVVKYFKEFMNPIEPTPRSYWCMKYIQELKNVSDMVRNTQKPTE